MTGLLPAFDAHRRLLFTVAYQMLGSVADAEDTVQDAWLRWSATDRSDVGYPRAWLVRTTTRLLRALPSWALLPPFRPR